MNAKKNKSSDAPADTEQTNAAPAAEETNTTATENTASSGNAQQLPAEPAPTPTMPPPATGGLVQLTIEGPVPLLGKTQGDAAAEAHAAGTFVALHPVDPPPNPPKIRNIKFPAGFDVEASGYSYQQIMDAAIAAHQANKAYCESLGDMSQVDWPDAPDWQHESCVNGVVYAISHNFPSSEEMHINWMKEKIAAGWRWGVEKNPEAKTHPCIMPYNQLPDEQRKKDDIFRDTIMKTLGPRAAAAKEEAPAEPQPPTEEAKAMAAMLECAAAMTGLYDVRDEGMDWPAVAMCLADYFRHEPAAPAAGGLMQLQLKKKVILLPNEDPRRVELILDLFRLALIRMEEFIAADAAEQIARLATPLPTARNRLDGEGPFDRDDDRLTKSDTGKALEQRV